MDEPLIKDIPSIKEILDDAKIMTTLKRAMPLLRPFLSLLGVKVEKIDEALTHVDDLARQTQELASIPDRFNNMFASRGWIIYDLMNVEVAKAAIEKAEAGDLDGAEGALVDYYSVETVKRKLQAMNGVAAFQQRMLLAQKALIDYEAERYHACVPVVLALLDGLVNELHEKRRGFSSEDIKLEAWNSIAAHSRGLSTLARIFQKGRYKTSVDQITIPYRHGIMHGMDLGYDNKTVAAKTWAALFAVRDWARKAEAELLVAPPEKPKETLWEIIQQIRENTDDKEKLAQWIPRDMRVGVDFPATGEPELFTDATPERRLAEYLKFWKARNYGYMARCISPMLGLPAKKLPARIRDAFGTKNLESFIVVEISDDAPAISEILIELVFEEGGKKQKRQIRFRMVNIDPEGIAVIRTEPNSEWGIIKPLYF